MTDERISIKAEPGQVLEYAVERMKDGKFYLSPKNTWQKPRDRTAYMRMVEVEPGRYEAELPEFEPGLAYCVHAVNVATQQLVVSQMIEGPASAATASMDQEISVVGSEKSPPTPAPNLAEVVAGVRLLAAHWLARAWAERQSRNFGIAALCVLAIFLLWPRGPSREDVEKARVLAEQRAIREVLAQDKALGQQIAQRVGVMDQYWDGSALVAEFAGRMDAIDLSGCPQDFQLAYKRHVAAWAAVARVKASNEGFNGAVKGFFTAGLSVLPAMSEVNQAMKEVQSSWSEVQHAAIRHGVAP